MSETSVQVEPDKYDRAIAYLTEHPEQIRDAWSGAYEHPGGSLFRFAGPSAYLDCPDWTKQICGCLTQISKTADWLPDDPNKYVAWTPELTEAIAADERIPKRPEHIRVEHLPVFAEWQRKLDRELNRGEA